MHESLLGHSPSYDNCYSGYLKMDEAKNNWIEYWVVIREQQMLFYSDECSEESGEVAIKTITLSSETRCELLQRRNYHFRFKLSAGTGSRSCFRLKCSSAFHRQQWISHIMLASAKDRDRVIELNSSVCLTPERNGVHRRTVSTESQISSDAESLHESESGLDSSGAMSDGTFSSLTSKSPAATPENPTATTTTTERGGSRGLLRRLSFKASNRLRRNSKSSPGTSTPSRKEELGFNDMRTPSPKSPSTRKGDIPPLASPKGTVEKVFVNPAFVPSPTTSPSISRRETKVEECDLIDMSQPL